MAAGEGQKVWIALLDEGGVYQGMRQADPREIGPGAVEVPANCDLTPGKYAWRDGRFVPLRARNVSVDDLHMRAVHRFIADVTVWADAERAAGRSAPPVSDYVREWLAWCAGKLDDATDYPYTEPARRTQG